MLSPKLIIIPAAVGFLLSFIISLFSKASFPIALLRGGIFLLVFGGLSVLIQFLVGRFIPELLDDERHENPMGDEFQPGNLVDVTVGDSVQEGADSGESQVMASVEDRIDNSAADGSVSPVEVSATVVEGGKTADGTDGLADFPDIGAFDSVRTPESPDVSEPVPDSVLDTGSVSQGSSSVSNPEAINMARAIQTILAKDN